MTLVLGGVRRAVHVGALIDAEAVGPLAGAPVAVMDLSSMQRLLGQPARVSRILIQTSARARGRVERELRALAGPRLIVSGAEQDVTQLEQALGPSAQASALFAVIGALLGFLFAFNAILLTVPERRQAIADLRLAGTTRSAIVQLVELSSSVPGRRVVDRRAARRLRALALGLSRVDRLPRASVHAERRHGRQRRQRARRRTWRRRRDLARLGAAAAGPAQPARARRDLHARRRGRQQALARRPADAVRARARAACRSKRDLRARSVGRARGERRARARDRARDPARVRGGAGDRGQAQRALAAPADARARARRCPRDDPSLAGACGDRRGRAVR